MKISDLARRSGFSTDTLRYYEKIGLVPRAARDAGGWRVYDASTLTWLAFLDRLRATGMPMRDRLTYARLRAEGDHTGPERRQLLEAHRDEVRARVAQLQDCLTVLDTKIDSYPKGKANDPAPTDRPTDTP
ncbi:MerR family transcriptional regulator [Sagittula sp. NFXS13]|uniref:MerR family transcriptional regulator n=1 Tax=Sagittula sp. NFXS13 TaxID=2819095 RepID=UPI0032E05604